MAPPKVLDGFQKADSGNLPSVLADMIALYFSNNSRYHSVESSGQKQLRATRSSYGDSAIGYVQVRYEEATCIVKCVVTPEHSVHAKGYSVYVKINTEVNEITECVCEDCISAQGGCKHAISFLFWLHRRSEEPSTTETLCYWKKSELSKCGTSLKFLKLSDICNLEEKPQNSSVLDAFKIQITNADCTLLNMQKELPFSKLSLYQLVLQYQNGNFTQSADSFIHYCMANMTKEECLEAEEKTRDQSKNKLWYELRFGRITASRLYEVSKCKTSDGSLVENIFGASKFNPTESMERGLRLEESVLKVVESIKTLKIRRSGLILNPDFPIFGASPDGISEEFVIEVKCPKQDIKTFIKDNKILPKYEAQLLLQMKFCKKLKSMFVIADPKFETNQRVYIFYYDFNENKLNNIMDEATNFWKKYVFDKFPKL